MVPGTFEVERAFRTFAGCQTSGLGRAGFTFPEAAGKDVCGTWRGTNAHRTGQCEAMSIEKESNGLPEIEVKRRTTRVNLSMVVGILIFFAVAVAVAFWAANRFG
jgi:hypothetical protein